ncbi:probable inactive receptor kinase At5g10020 isoform X2 [Mercurialis annua]|uniref:probable inactive receptor kinase At5g10020 isoform X2 n=1 Tax=Mercurialis annua TaxID=3986 RepID=UPI00215E0F1D|nr:probable inactive receptor kinase At5g10020 isoform X2 [Mercurialis annua]
MQTISLMLVLVVVVVSVYGESEFESLLELKKGIQKHPFLVSWDSKSLASNGCPQDWYGVVCVDGHVASITLNDAALVGNFGFPLLSALQMLRNLSISNNQLTGTLSNLPPIHSLEYLDISSNLFQGIIPSGFPHLLRLKYLDLGGNSFSGDIMNLVSQLGGVLHLDLSSNHFTGSLDLGLGDDTFISSIQYFNISHNSLVGQLFAHDGIPYFDSLEVFDASNNQLTGDIPPFQFVVSLRILRLGTNRLSGSLPEALLQDKSMLLSELDLSLNQLQGPVRSITSATLKKLNLSSNNLSGPLPATVGQCAVVDLSNNMLSGDLSRIQNWGNYVEVIQLSNNFLTGPLPNQTSQFLRLTSLKISNNSINGELPPVLTTYSKLQVVDLSLNSLSGSLLPDLLASTTLTHLNLSANNFTGPISPQEPQDTTQNMKLVSLDLSFNSFDGHLPPEISKFNNLVYLNLSNNRLEGAIPEDLPDGLREFNVSSNNLSGVVPDNLRRFPDSAFHPGNLLLIFPNMPSSQERAPDLTLREHQSHMKRLIKVSLIAGMVGTATVLVILCLLIYYWNHRKQDRRNVKGDEHNEDVPQEHSLSHTSAVNKNLDQSLSFSFHQSLVPSSQLGSAGADHGDTSSVQKNLNNHPESRRKDEGLSSPLSHLSSSNPSPSKSRLSFDNPGVLQVYSPEKLAGELYLFDVSLVLTAEELSCAPAEVIGKSCHGSLYKATLNSGNELAVKWLKEGIAKGRKEFAREVRKLGNIRHPNLVSLQGYYWGPKDHEKMILSNYVNGHCLAFHLQDIADYQLLDL